MKITSSERCHRPTFDPAELPELPLWEVAMIVSGCAAAVITTFLVLLLR